MEAAKLIVILLVSFCGALQTILADYEDYEDEFVANRHKAARRRALEAYHPHPQQVVQHLNANVHRSMKEAEGMNNTRRSLSHHPYKGPCMANNPIDSCWRCRKDWMDDRKRLARCALGFGRNTTGGLEGEFYTVTDNSDDNVQDPKPGTLRYGVIQKEPLWIIFAKSMCIRLQQELMINSNKTIDGRGVQVRICKGSGLTVQFVCNVIIHCIKVYDIVPGSGAMIRDSTDHIGLRTASDGDAISIFGSTNVWVDHISMSNCKDGLVDVIQESTAVTISNCHMTHHNDVMLFGANDNHPQDKVEQVTVAFNHFGKGLVQRMPRCRFGFFHVVNNDYTHWLMYAIGGSAHPTILCQGNRFRAPPNPNAKNVSHRDYCTEAQWKTWSWTSEKDQLLNDAVFITSGSPPEIDPAWVPDMIPPAEGCNVRKLTRFAGMIKCRKDQEC